MSITRIDELKTKQKYRACENSFIETSFNGKNTFNFHHNFLIFLFFFSVAFYFSSFPHWQHNECKKKKESKQQFHVIQGKTFELCGCWCFVL